MDKARVRKLLEDVKSRKVAVEEALHALKVFPYQDVGFAKIDTHRELRKGFPEVIFCKGKTLEQIKQIAKGVLARSAFLMATRADRKAYEAIKSLNKKAVYYETAGIVVIGRRARKRNKKRILVLSGGTSDIPVAEEAAVTAELMGNNTERLYDVGVAGIHRVFGNQEKIFDANVIIIVAGMEGALASIVGGLVGVPVIAVPTSIGYGASFGGVAALLTMLNSCAPGVTVVNIDNGFGAGYAAGIINRMAK